MNSMDRKRYLLALLVAGVEAGMILGVKGLLLDSNALALSGCAMAIVFLIASVWDSVHTRAYALTIFPKTRPPLSWTTSFMVIGIGCVVFGTYLLVDAFGVGIALAAWRIAGSAVFLYIGSALGLACYHLWRNVPGRNADAAQDP